MVKLIKEVFDKLVTIPLLRTTVGSQVRHLMGYVSGLLMGLNLEAGLVEAFTTNLEQTLISAAGLILAYAYSRLKERGES